MRITYEEAKQNKEYRYMLARAWWAARNLERYHNGVPGGWLRWFVTAASFGEMVYDNQAKYWRYFRIGDLTIELPCTPGMGARRHVV